jgi:hypothetical protein
MSERRIETYSDFWPFYVCEHANPANRIMHFIGTTTAMVVLIYAISSQIWWLIPLALVAGYGPAWMGHFGIEKNRPASFKYPLWSFISDFRMWSLMLTGRMSAEVERCMAISRK